MGYMLLKPPKDKLKDFLRKKKTKIAALAITIFVVLEFVCEIILGAFWFSNGIINDKYTTTCLLSFYKFMTSLIAFSGTSSLCLVACFQPNKDMVLQAMIFFPLANFAVFVSLEIIPFVIFSFVHPFWASSFLFILTECLVIAHVIYIYGPKFKVIFKCKAGLLDIYGAVIPGLLIYILVLYLIVFEALIIQIASSGTIKSIISFLPPLFLPFTDWFISYIYKAVGIADEKTSNPHSSETASAHESGTRNYGATSHSERIPLMQHVSES